jgi:hypothetical protein
MRPYMRVGGVEVGAVAERGLARSPVRLTG